MSLMLGANAHINNDLPQVLTQLMQQQKSDDPLTDLVKMDKILMQSGREIIGLFHENNALLDFLKRRLQFMYYRPAMYTILFWRLRAWRNYKKLKKGTTPVQAITEMSNRIANRQLFIAKILAYK